LKIVITQNKLADSMYSLRKICYFAFFGIAVMLMVVLVFSFGQYRLNSQYRQIIKQSEQAIFELNATREQMISSLIEKDYEKVSVIADDLRTLNSTLVDLQENNLIPTQYKLDMVNRIDLTEIAILAKDLVNQADKAKASLNLQTQMRGIGEYLLRFDRVIVGQMKAKVVHFQTIVIGILGVVLSMVTFTLLLLYKKTIRPLSSLTEQIKKPSVVKQGITPVENDSVEIAELRTAMNNIIETSQTTGSVEQQDSDPEANDRFAGVINAITNLLNGIINYAQLLDDSFDQQQEKKEEKKMIQSIISYAERISAILSKT